MWYVYILQGNKYYVGMTNNLERRLGEHKRKNSYYTKRLGENIKLIGYFQFKLKEQAVDMEIKIKKSGHIKRYIEDSKFNLSNNDI